jgi:hypothetical protein
MLLSVLSFTTSSTFMHACTKETRSYQIIFVYVSMCACMILVLLEMAMGISPSRNGSPSPSPRGKKFTVPIPANAHGGAFSPIPVLVGEFIPVWNPAGNLSPLEVQYLKINLN